MKQLLKTVFNQLPFSYRYFIKKKILQKIDEVEIVYEILRYKKGVMIDVGAHFGTSLESFMTDGWEIHAFEPDPNNRQKLLNRIKGKGNVKISNEAVTNESGLELSFYGSEVSTGISGLSSFHASHKEITKVKTITLQDYIVRNKVTGIDFLKIDTEGHDLFVLEGFDWENHNHPQVIVSEFEDNKSLSLGYSTLDLIHFLKNKGYSLIISEWNPIVEYGLSHNWKQFIFDNFEELDFSKCWGNIIAFKQNKTLNSFKSKI